MTDPRIKYRRWSSSNSSSSHKKTAKSLFWERLGTEMVAAYGKSPAKYYEVINRQIGDQKGLLNADGSVRLIVMFQVNITIFLLLEWSKFKLLGTSGDHRQLLQGRYREGRRSFLWMNKAFDTAIAYMTDHQFQEGLQPERWSLCLRWSWLSSHMKPQNILLKILVK